MSDAASSSSPSAAPGRVLRDAWSPGGQIRLDGPLERGSLSDRALGWFSALVGLGAVFLIFQVLVGPALLLLQVGLDGLQTMQQDPSAFFATYSRELILSNSGAQVIGIILPVVVLLRFHTESWERMRQLIRLRGVSPILLGLSLAGVLALQPVAQWLAQVNQMLPLPESIQAYDASQMEIVKQVLASDFGLAFNLAMLAVVPGVCEEILFRGYAQRHFERGAGIVGGIVLSGLLFGLYHVRLTQLLPLAFLGIYLAYLTWRTGSLIPAMVAHFCHNALAIGLATYAEDDPALDPAALESASIPAWAVALGAIAFAAIATVLHRTARRLRADRAAEEA